MPQWIVSNRCNVSCCTTAVNVPINRSFSESNVKLTSRLERKILCYAVRFMTILAPLDLDFFNYIVTVFRYSEFPMLFFVERLALHTTIREEEAKTPGDLVVPIP